MDRIVCWWLWRANDVGVDTANSELDHFLNSDEISCSAVLWVYGVESTQIIQLSENVWIYPPNEMPDSEDKENVLRSKWKHDVNFSPVHSAALVAEVTVNKTSSDKPRNDKQIFECYRTLNDIALLLNVLPEVCCAGGYRTSYAPASVPHGPFGGRGGGVAVADILPKNQPSSITPDSIVPLQNLLDGFKKLSPSWKERISRSVARLGQSKSRADHNDKALDLGIALEMVLLHAEHNKNELPGQLHNHFRLRGAWLIGESFDERSDLFGKLGKIYTQRSQVAHNGVLSKSDGENILDHISIAEKILSKLIVNGPPSDWNRLVLGEQVG